jgi:hypothetical protein
MGLAASLNSRKRRPWDLSRMGRNFLKSASAVEYSLNCVSDDSQERFDTDIRSERLGNDVLVASNSKH